MEKKEFYRHILPHFQQPGQAYFVTWCLKDSIPQKALSRYTLKLQELKSLIELRKEQNKNDQTIKDLTDEYYLTRRKYLKIFDDLLAINRDQPINLNYSEFSEIIIEALTFWQGSRVENYAWCIMPNHVHWVFQLEENDTDGKPVYLQDIMHSVKRQTANKINKLTGRNGQLWQKESFDTTIRDDKHLMSTIEYTLNNPVVAGYVDDWKDWKGCWCTKF